MFPGWTSFRVFLLTTWSSFEAEFAEIGVRLDDRMPVVVCTAAVGGYKRVQVEARIRAEAAEGNNSPPPRNLRRILADLMILVEEKRKLLTWLAGLSNLNFDADHERIFEKWHTSTGNWLLESDEFAMWLGTKESCLLWCHGTGMITDYPGISPLSLG